MNPFQELGVELNCSIEVAKAAFRRLAQQFHPDRDGGNEERFKNVKIAWEKIEGGYRDMVNEPPPKSSFGGAPKPPPKYNSARPEQPHAGKPAPGYEAHKPPVLPRTSSRSRGKGYPQEITVQLEITEDQAFEGCTVPFWHDGTVQDFIVRPGSTSHTEQQSFLRNPMIGGTLSGMVTIRIELTVLAKRRAPEEQTRDAEMTLPLCAIGLFTGGKVRVADHLGEQVTITIPAGHDPATTIKVLEHGYGLPGNRGALIVKIVPVFKLPSELNQNELLQLRRLNEMTT